MWIIPAIDILGGRCVRLRGGDYDEVQTYDENPSAVAERFLTPASNACMWLIWMRRRRASR